MMFDVFECQILFVVGFREQNPVLKEEVKDPAFRGAMEAAREL
jgi:hypothetical protein